MDTKGQLYLTAMKEIKIKRNQYLELYLYIFIRTTLILKRYFESIQVISVQIGPIRKLSIPRLLRKAIKRLGVRSDVCQNENWGGCSLEILAWLHSSNVSKLHMSSKME